MKPTNYIPPINISITPDGDVRIDLLTVVNDQLKITTSGTMSVLAFTQKAIPIIETYRPGFRDGITEVLPAPDEDNGRL